MQSTCHFPANEPPKPQFIGFKDDSIIFVIYYCGKQTKTYVPSILLPVTSIFLLHPGSYWGLLLSLAPFRLVFIYSIYNFRWPVPYAAKWTIDSPEQWYASGKSQGSQVTTLKPTRELDADFGTLSRDDNEIPNHVKSLGGSPEFISIYTIGSSCRYILDCKV